MANPTGLGEKMKNKDLARDYIERAGYRLAAVEALYQQQAWADVVRESQEIVELCLKGLLRLSNVEVPRLHDVSGILKNSATKLPQTIKPQVETLAKISKQMRRDRELAFYGTEDLTPSDFYQEEDAQKAQEDAKWVWGICQEALGKQRK